MNETFLPGSLEGWLATVRDIALGAVAAAGILWRAIDAKVGREADSLRRDLQKMIDDESGDRQTADGHIDQRVMTMAQQLHVYMGKLDILSDRIIASEERRIREIGALQEEVRVGFARIEGKLDRQHRGKEGER